MEFKYMNCPGETDTETKQKLFETALEKGMAQIEDRGYYKKFTGSGKAIYLAAFAFLGRDDIDIVQKLYTYE